VGVTDSTSCVAHRQVTYLGSFGHAPDIKSGQRRSPALLGNLTSEIAIRTILRIWERPLLRPVVAILKLLREPRAALTICGAGLCASRQCVANRGAPERRMVAAAPRQSA
jgi:hypothetical protein